MSEKEERLSSTGDAEPLVAPEHKGMIAKGIPSPLAGRMTMEQQMTLIAHGYTNDLVGRWTQYRADQEIRRKGLTVRPVSEQFEEIDRQRKQQQHRCEELRREIAEEKERRRFEQREMEKDWPSCPVCGSKISTGERLTKHLSKVHGAPRPAE